MEYEINEEEYKKSLYEVNEILNYLNEEEFNKIPLDLLDKIEQEKAIDYKWEYDCNKELKEQKVSEYTFAILEMLNIEFLLSPERKNLVEQLHKFNDYIY